MWSFNKVLRKYHHLNHARVNIMSESKGKSLRLSFKGDKPKKRKRSTGKHGRSESSSSSRKRRVGDASDVEDVGGDEQAWVAVETERDLNGPCFLFCPSRSDAVLHCVAFQPTLQSVEAVVVLPSDDETAFDDPAGLLASDPGLAEELDGAEIVPKEASPSTAASLVPTSVYQVWIATKVPGSSAPVRFTFKSAEGKFLGADKTGLLRASMEARGPQEEWTLESSDGGSWKLRSVHGRYLGLDTVAGGRTVVRADCDAADAQAAWTFKVQWKHRHAARHSSDPKADYLARANDPTAVPLVARDQVIAHELQTFRSRAGSRYIPSNYESSLSREERRALRKADKQGRLAEEMLDRRSKLKSDKYA